MARLQLPCNANKDQSVRSLEMLLHFTLLRSILQAHKQDVTAVIIPTGNVPTVLYRGPRSSHKPIPIWILNLPRLDGPDSSSSVTFRIDDSAQEQECMAANSDNEMLLILFLGKEQMPVDTRSICRFSKLSMNLWPAAGLLITLL